MNFEGSSPRSESPSPAVPAAFTAGAAILSEDSIWIDAAAKSPANIYPQIVRQHEGRWEGVYLHSFTIPDACSGLDAYHPDHHAVTVLREGVAEEQTATTSSMLYPGTVRIAPAGSSFRSLKLNGARLTNVFIKRSFLSRAASQLLTGEEVEIPYRFGVRDQQIELLAVLLEAEVKDGMLSGRLYGESLGIALAAHLLARYAAKPPLGEEPRGGLSPYYLRRTIDYIQANLGQNLGLCELASNVDMSPYHFARMFKQSTELTPHHYVLSKRMERAKQFLVEHKQSVAEIAIELGFSDQSHFARIFRGLVGVTPKKYSYAHPRLITPPVPRAQA
jgi:AraC family transcriptional regulator